MVGLSSAMFVSLQTLTTSSTITGSSIQTSQTLDKLVTELQSAVYVSERSATAIGFTIPDQTGDGYNERIRYSWTGSAGGPLTRQYNGGTAQTLVSNVDVFSLTPSYKSVAESYPSVGVEDAAESLLIDHYGTTSAANNSSSFSNFYSQYFAYSLPANAYAWRPTTLKVMAYRGASFCNIAAQMRLATSGLIPSTTTFDSYTLDANNLPISYAWVPIPCSQMPPLTSGTSLCLVLQPTVNQANMLTVQSCTNYSGMLLTTNTGSTWTYFSTKTLVSQLYGKLTTSSGTQTLSSNYLTSMAVSLRPTGSSATQQSTAPLLNHPEMLSGKWELDFTKNPTTVDINGDNAMDFVVHGGSAFDTSQLNTTTGVWTTSSTQLDTNTGNDFSKTTIVDVKLKNTTVGGTGATFAMNALRSGSNCVPISASLALQSDGTQTLTISKKTNDSTTQTVIYIPGLPAQPVQLHLIIVPTTNAISVTVNDVQKGTFSLTPYASTDASRYASIAASGSTAEFSYFRIRVLEQ